MAYDPTQQHLDSLSPSTRNKAYWMVWAVRSVGIPLIITSSIRTQVEQYKLVLAGRSKTMNSLHLQGRAFDVDLLGVSRDAVPKAFWDILGPWAEENLQLGWGGRWRSIYDPGHFEDRSL